MYIENINSPKDIKELSVEQLSVLAGSKNCVNQEIK